MWVGFGRLGVTRESGVVSTTDNFADVRCPGWIGDSRWEIGGYEGVGGRSNTYLFYQGLIEYALLI